jgi:hypothetical protein
MVTKCLTWRRVQLRLLAEACAREAPAKIGARARGAVACLHDTRLMRLDQDGILVRMPQDDAIQTSPPGLAVEAVFDDQHESYRFTAQTRGDAQGLLWSDPQDRLLRLTLPPFIERRPRRLSARLQLDEAEGIDARLTNMLNQSLRFGLRIVDISTGGFAGIMDRGAAYRPGAVGPFWAEFTLPSERSPIECAVRLTHCDSAPLDQQVRCGWAFCGGDDDTAVRWNIARIWRFIAARQRHQTEPVAVAPQARR